MDGRQDQIRHPDKINSIFIDNLCTHGCRWPMPVISDGNHRFMAAEHLKLHVILCKYSGRVDLRDYLTGKSDMRPSGRVQQPGRMKK